MAVTVKKTCDEAFGQGPWGMRRHLMVYKGKAERPTAVVDRRVSKMDRRQFIDIGWPVVRERRVAAADRRQSKECRTYPSTGSGQGM